MKVKLTLSVPESTVRLAKQTAISRHTTVSALFTTSIEQWARTDSALSSTGESKGSAGLNSLLGVFRSQVPFDAKSARIREKHG